MQVSCLKAELARRMNRRSREKSQPTQAIWLEWGTQSSCCRWTKSSLCLKRSRAAVAIADTDGFIDPGDKDFAVPDFSCSGRRDDGLNSLLQQLVRNHGFDLDLGQKINRILASAIELGVTLLAPVAACFKDGHALDADGEESVFQCVEL